MMIDKYVSERIRHFIGIDISKNKLDFSIIDASGTRILTKVISNEHGAILKLVDKFVQSISDFSISSAVFCMEDTGIYTNNLLKALAEINAIIVKENPLKIKLTLGLIRGKSDAIDAYRIAMFALRHRFELMVWTPRRRSVEELHNATELRDRLVTISTMLAVPLKEKKAFIPLDLVAENLMHCKKSIAAVKSDILAVEKRQHEIVHSDKRLRRLFEIITSVPGVGKFTAYQLLISTNEFLNINEGKKLACYAGIAPFKNESGLSTTRGRVSKYANRKLKSLLHICAVRALRLEPEMKIYYQRKTEIEKKSKMLVLNIIRNKLVKRICSCVNKDKLYVKVRNE